MPASTPYYTPHNPSMPRAANKPGPRPGSIHPAPFRPAGSPPGAISYAPPPQASYAPAPYAPSAASSAVPSLTTGSYSYARSTGSEDSSTGTPSIDLIDLMTERVSHAVNSLPMDRSIAEQAQTSGALNAKQRELAELQALAQRRLRGTKANLADGFKAAKEVGQDLRWTQKRVSQMNAQAAAKYPTAYKTASRRYPSPEV